MESLSLIGHMRLVKHAPPTVASAVVKINEFDGGARSFGGGSGSQTAREVSLQRGRR